jgi:hypothetical protein
MKTNFEAAYFEHLIQLATWSVGGTFWVWIPELNDNEPDEETLIKELWAL